MNAKRPVNIVERFDKNVHPTWVVGTLDTGVDGEMEYEISCPRDDSYFCFREKWDYRHLADEDDLRNMVKELKEGFQKECPRINTKE